MKAMKLFRRTAPAPVLAPDRTSSQPVETGTVRWLRELDDALAESVESGRPVFLLFQEVPGCAGCKQFGADVLSDPFVVEAIEQEFVPLLIHNNSPGRDAEVLNAYGEPAWNFQVVRFLDSFGVDLIPRRDRVWETGPLLTRMVASLETANRDVPDHLRLLEQQHSTRLEEVFLAQPCFWVGEMELGQIEGVVRTEAGFMHGHEVTRVLHDPTVITIEELVAEAGDRRVADAVFTDSPQADLLDGGFDVRPPDHFEAAPAADQKRQLGSPSAGSYTESQLTKLNAFVHTRHGTQERFLFPNQRR